MSYPPQDETNYDQPHATPGQGYPQQGWNPQQPYPQQGGEAQMLGYAGAVMTPRDNSGRARTAFVLLWVTVVFTLIQLVGNVIQFAMTDLSELESQAMAAPGTAVPGASPFGGGEFTGAMVAQLAFGCVGIIGGIVWVVMVVFYMMWQHRAVWNAQAQGNQTKFSPAWSVGWWFIPFANLVFVGLVLRDLWRASAGRGSASGLPNVIWALWVLPWALMLATFVGGIIVAVQSVNGTMDESDFLRTFFIGIMVLTIVNTVIQAAFYAAAAIFVRRVQVAQTDGQ